MNKFLWLTLLSEFLIITIAAWLLSLFALSFASWLIVGLVLLILFNLYQQRSLINFMQKNSINYTLNPLENLKQHLNYHKKLGQKERFKNLRVLSKLNKNIQRIPDGVIFCNLDGEINWANHAAQTLFDFYWHKKIAKNICTVIFYTEFKHYFHHSNQATHNKRPLVLFTHNQKYIEINISRYDEKNYIVIAREITQLIKLLQIRKNFISDLNHEIRTPLTVMQGYLEILEQDPPLDLRHKAIAVMVQQNTRIEHLTRDLSLLAKIETADQKEHIRLNISQILQQICQSLDGYTNALNRKINFEFEITPNLYVKGSEVEITSLLNNLIYNAINHSDPLQQKLDLLIHIKLQNKANKVYFRVKDNGVGIEFEHLTKLTQRFYRVDKSRQNNNFGSGLGLSIAKHVLLNHDSELSIKSKPNQGASFSFELNLLE